MRTPAPGRKHESEIRSPIDDLDRTAEQLQRVHAMVFRAIACLRAASDELRSRVSPGIRRHGGSTRPL